MTERERIEGEIKVLEKKLSLLEEIENHKTPCEEAYKNAYGVYPNDEITYNNMWSVFQKGYYASQEDYKVGEYQEPVKDEVSLYKRFENEGAYSQLYYDSALQVVREFLLDEAVIENETKEYITFTLQKSLLEVPNDL